MSMKEKKKLTALLFFSHILTLLLDQGAHCILLLC
uniref:Uncharacterized protein n=1 Tax=Anguilla anguilla TaxID=7936 RepID=A0A0E9S8A0_ANGAN